MLTEKVFRRHQLDTTRIIATQNHDDAIELSNMEGEVETATMKLPKDADPNSFAEGMLKGMHYQGSETRRVKLKDAKKR